MLTIQSVLPAVRQFTATKLPIWNHRSSKTASLILVQSRTNCPIRTTYICVIGFTYIKARLRHGKEPVTSSSGKRRSLTEGIIKQQLPFTRRVKGVVENEVITPTMFVRELLR